MSSEQLNTTDTANTPNNPSNLTDVLGDLLAVPGTRLKLTEVKNLRVYLEHQHGLTELRRNDGHAGHYTRVENRVVKDFYELTHRYQDGDIWAHWVDESSKTKTSGIAQLRPAGNGVLTLIYKRTLRVL